MDSWRAGCGESRTSGSGRRSGETDHPAWHRAPGRPHWADGGPTATTNLACLCDYHHDGQHDGDFTITGDADDPGGLTFTTRGGFPIRPGPTFATPTDPPPQPPPTTTYRGPTGQTLNLRWVTFHEPREQIGTPPAQANNFVPQ